jgi:putative molybdopterin biosynthesis protein
MPELMTTREVAHYLRLKERKIYDLVRLERIPCIRLTGKLLFPKPVLDRWLLRHTEFAGPVLRPAPPVVAGSHDPLLEWAVRESGCNLALLAGGSEDGVRRLAAGEAVLAGMHIIDGATGEYNIATVRDTFRLAEIVLIGWAGREQGLVLAPGNPLGLRSLAELKAKRVRVARRQEGAGAQTLLRHLLQAAGLRLDDLAVVEAPCLTETDLALAVLDGKADCGLAIRAVARQFRLDFAPLHRERFDLLMRRRDYFEPPIQRLLQFAATPGFRERAEALGGYDLACLGSIIYNA